MMIALPWLASAQSLPVSQDTFFSPGIAINYGSSPAIIVGGTSNYQGLIQFDLTQLPAGTTSSSISKATLTFFVDKVTAPGTINVYLANGPWAESLVTGTNGAPVAGPAVASAVAITTADEYISIDATAALQSWLNGVTNSGFLLKANSDGVSVLIDSKENSFTSHPASLAVTWVGHAGATGAAGSTGAAAPSVNQFGGTAAQVAILRWGAAALILGPHSNRITFDRTNI